MNRLFCIGTAAVLALALVSGACDDTLIDPFDADTEKYFTVYGYLDELEDDHTLRVVPVSRRPEVIESPSDPDAQIDARVFTTEVFTDTRIEWRHELAQFEDGSYGHVFAANFNVRPGQVYRLEVIREDGRTTTAETAVPLIRDISALERAPEFISTDSSEVYQDIHIPGIASPWDIKAVYGWVIETGGRRVFVDYGRFGQRTSGGGWDIRLNYADDQDRVMADIQAAKAERLIAPNAVVRLGSVGVMVRVLDQDWDPPDGVFDPEDFARPGALSNVENGYGFFGSIGLYIEEWSAGHLSGTLGYAD